MILVIATMLALTLTTSAHDDTHNHNWDFYSMGTEIEVYCDCGISISIPLDPAALLCAHSMEEYQSSNFHGETCIRCGFGVHAKHSWEISYEAIKNGEYSHEAVCVECGFEATHKLVSYHDDTHHYITCRKCDIEEIHGLSYSYANQYCHEVECEDCPYTHFEAHNFNEDDICVECEILTGMVSGLNTEFDDEGNAVENQYYVLVDGEERMFIIDEYPDDINLGDIITFETDGEYVYEIIDVLYVDDIDESDIFFIEDEYDLEWLWWDDFDAVVYDTETMNTSYPNPEVGDEIVIVTPENPLQRTIYVIVN